ncbi:MAG: hypothetical protein HY825_07360 [Acidobacteria bacterium]|nr:hypothetical protein [Acidobacteriota bacterium]
MVTWVVAAAVSAVLAGTEVVFVDTSVGRAVGRVELGASGIAVFAAPDSRAIVPLADVDATALVSLTGEPRRWPGRYFPLFFDEMDRMHVVLPGAVATLTYPERLTIAKAEVPRLTGARRAAVSADGRVVVVIPDEAGSPSLVVLITGPSGGVGRVELPAVARAVAVSPAGDWFVGGLVDGSLALVAPGLSRPVANLVVGSTVLALGVTGEYRGLLAAVEGARGPELVEVRVDPKGKTGLREHRRTPMSVQPLAIGMAGSDALVVTVEGLLILNRLGPKRRFEVAIPGASGVAVLPGRARSAVPAWSE